MSRRRELAGQQFGNLTVLAYHSSSPKGKALWCCICICGKTRVVQGGNLITGISKSCGCSRGLAEKSTSWKGHKDISGRFWGIIRDNRRGKYFDLTIEYGHQLWLDQDKKCTLSGVPIEFPKPGEKTCTASLDRIDSNVGYVQGNVQWVHKDINLMKNKLEQSYFIQLCKSVAETSA